MSSIHILTRKGLLATCFFLAMPAWLTAQTDEQDPTEDQTQETAEESLLAPDAPASDMVDRIVFRDETTDQVLDLLERLTGRSIIRPQALPAATFTFNSQKPMTREEAILALESMLTINGIGVTPLGDMFLKVVPLAQLRSQAPEFLSESSLDLPASGRVVSRMISLEFLSLEEIQTQLNLMITSGSGSIIPFPKANSMLITDTVSNLQAIEELLAVVDRPFVAQTETHFFPMRYARAEEMIAQIEALAGTAGNPELSGRTILTADERSNQIILVTDARQVERFATLIEKLDVQAEVVTQNEVIFLKHATSTEVASILSQLATGRSGGGGGAGGSGSSARSGGAGSSARAGSAGSAGSRSNQRSGMQSNQRGRSQGNQRQPNVPQIPGVRAQQATEGESEAAPAEGAEAALGQIAGSVNESDFSETLTILPDERSNAIIVSGTRQDIALISDLIEKLDIILAQVRIEVFIAEVTLNDNDGYGIESFGFDTTEGMNNFNFNVSGPGYTLSRENLTWEAVLNAARSNSDISVLSTPTIVTMHNQEGSILVGERRPIITGTIADSQFSSSIRSQINYEDIGIELFVLPLIGADGTVQLEIEQNVDDVVGTIPIDGNDQPIIGTRRATSFVSVSDGQTVVLGGLQSTREQEAYGRLALLGRIPILGPLFSYKTMESTRTELIVFIRPTVLATTDAAHEDAQEQISRQTREPYIRHQMDPEKYRHPEAADHSEEALELREQSLRRQAEESPAAEPNYEQELPPTARAPEPASTPPPVAPPPPPPAPAPEPQARLELPATEFESESEDAEAEPRQPVRRGGGAGKRF